MPQSQAPYLEHLTEVPGGWPLATVIDAFADLAAYGPSNADATRAREAVSHRLVELWASQPAEAEAWLKRCREHFATELAGKETRQELLSKALLRHGAAEWGKYGSCDWRLSEAGLLRGEPCGSAAQRERRAALYLQEPHIRDRCPELAERLVQAESLETARKRQKLEEETAERRRLEAELQKSQQEGRELRNRLAAAEAQVSSKDVELQTAQSESAKCKCEELATRAAAAEAAAAELQKELGQLQEEHSKCQEHCEELAKQMDAEASEHAKTKELLAQAEADAAETQLEVKRLQEESRSCQERCPQPAEEAGSKEAELRLEKDKAVLQGRCEQLQHQLAKAEAKLDLMQNLREEIGMYKERLRGLEHERTTRRKKQDADHFGGPAFIDAAASSQESNLAEQLGYRFVEDDGTSSSLLSHSSWFSVKPLSQEPHCFMLDAIFKTRSYDTDFYIMGRDLRKGSQVVAGDDATILEVVSNPEVCEVTEIVDLQAGSASLQVTPDHLVQVADAAGESIQDLYLPAGRLKAGDLVLLDSGEPVALASVDVQPMKCQVLKIRLDPHRPVAVFRRPPCILSLGLPKKPSVRRGRPPSHVQGGSRPSDGRLDDGASIPITAPGEYMD